MLHVSGVTAAAIFPVQKGMSLLIALSITSGAATFGALALA